MASPAVPLSIVSSLMLFVLLSWLAGRTAFGWVRRHSRMRGSRVVKRGVLRSMAGRMARRHSANLSLAGIAVPPLDETKHFKLVGTTGTGKSTAIQELLTQALARGDRAVIADPDGGYCKRFFRQGRGDRILNPFDARSERWDPFAEMEHSYDAEEVARAMVPDSEDPATREWRAYARTLLSSVLRTCRMRGMEDLDTLWHLLSAAGTDELRPYVVSTPAQPFVDPDNSRMLSSIRSVLLSSIAAFDYVRLQRAAPFCVRRWVRGGQGVLFLPYQATQITALRGAIAGWVRLAIFETMSGTGPADQRLWFVIDELDALGAIDGLKDALARLRKFGGRCVIGFQSIAQVSGTYGSSDAQTIVENCGNTLLLRCSSSEQGGTAQFASRLVGEREVLRYQTSQTRDRSLAWGLRDSRRSVQVSEQVGTEAALLPSEIEQLPDLCGYLKLASSGSWLQVRLGG